MRRFVLWAWGKSIAHLSFSEFDVNKVSLPKKIGALLSFGPNLDSVCRQTNLDRELYLARGLNDLGEDQNHPDYQDDIEDHSDVKKYVEESAVSIFIV